MNRSKSSLATIAATLLAALPIATFAQAPPKIIQPGAPGEPSRVITAAEASDLAGILFTEADVEFMQGMIAHHAQALTMCELLETRSERPVMRELAKRIDLSQEDEIKMMQDWLRSNGQEVPDAEAHHHMHGDDLMPGMLSREEMRSLEEAEALAFDRLFLELMIAHHQGALVMVEDLLSTPGAAQESTVFGFTSDIVADQTAEIERMANMLAGLSEDPRVHLKAGFRDAGEAAMHLELVASLPKPTGFFNPDAPEGVPIPLPEQEDEDGEEEEGDEADDAGDDTEGDGEEEAEDAKRENPAARGAAILNFANSDIAFARDVLFEGNFHGFNTYNVEDPTSPQLVGSVVCPGGQGDVSVVGNLLIMSVEQTRGRLDCGLQGVANPVSAERFRGIRIFDISDLAVPQQVAAVQTCRGSHTHTVVTDPDDDGNIYVFGSGTSSVRSGDELEGCSDAPPGEDPETALFSIDVIQIPLANPEGARVVNRPRIFRDPESGRIAGLWEGGNHGRGTQKTSVTNQCHDITVFEELGLAAGACSGNGILLDISDPVNPVRLHQVVDPGFAYWHSATFNNDGTKVIFTDEWGGGMRPRCRASDPRHWGADAIFEVVDGKLEFGGYFKIPAPQTENENCVAHNGSLIPVPGRDIMVQAWYQGGVSVFDFTDASNPTEIAFFDRGPIDSTQLMMGGHWSAYWYGGHIYATEIARGLDVLKLVPSEYLTQNEIDAASLVTQEVFNPQQQKMIEWPAVPVVAHAYLDQLDRAEGLAPGSARPLRAALDAAEKMLRGGRKDGGETASQLAGLADELATLSPQARRADRARLEALVEIVRGVSDRVR